MAVAAVAVVVVVAQVAVVAAVVATVVAAVVVAVEAAVVAAVVAVVVAVAVAVEAVGLVSLHPYLLWCHASDPLEECLHYFCSSAKTLSHVGDFACTEKPVGVKDAFEVRIVP